jgi:hypothetical protein
LEAPRRRPRLQRRSDRPTEARRCSGRSNQKIEPQIPDCGYATELGAKINPAVMHEPPLFTKALARVARWRPRTPSGYQPGYEFDQRLTEEQAREAVESNRVEFLSRMGDMATLLNDNDYFSATQVVRNFCVASEDRLPTKEEYEAAMQTVLRIEKEKGFEYFRAVFPRTAPSN